METTKHRAQVTEKGQQEQQRASVQPQVSPDDVQTDGSEHPSGVYEGEGVGRREDSGRYPHGYPPGHHDYDTTKHIEDAPQR